MSDDRKLPVIAPNQTAPVARETYTQSPVHGRSLFGIAVSRFRALWDTKTIDANSARTRAMSEYMSERSRLADATLNADLRIANYVNHRDDLIASDHQRHLQALEDERTQRELAGIRRAEMLRDATANQENDAVRRDFDARILEQVKGAQLTEAEWQNARAKWGLEAFQKSMPYRQDRLRFLAANGALEKEIDALIAEQARDKELRSVSASNEPPAEPTPSANAIKSLLDETIAELTHEIELAEARHATTEEINALRTFLARLTSKRDQAQNG